MYGSKNTVLSCGLTSFVAWLEKPTQCHSRLRGNDINLSTQQG
ncbi:hypothetical protein RAMDARK_0900 [Rickettsia amblyommatis str. Darkwater]|uniref:Uncharacterized protein n=1 Tax=Rickettsia amblyommatis str. Ac/Pa TaxID=1359164 RepID=A0A0F3N2C1_RICAM|nr:hypothetical protein APHACPA_1226 [Rickettsia amblyommatis str. Ac/Pa]KJV93241.1 hypothetical protein RAMDARK_0900 [Rickettsia amblyommatis str. Darkwater]